MEAIVFNPAQLQLLEMLSFVKSEKSLVELKQAISNHFANLTQKRNRPSVGNW